MSADNGIYIGVFPTESGKEYRVIHAQAIGNCDYGDEEMQDNYRVLYFGGTHPLSDRNQAWKLAREKAEEILEDSGVLEYGVSLIEFHRPLPQKSVKEADQWLNAH